GRARVGVVGPEVLDERGLLGPKLSDVHVSSNSLSLLFFTNAQTITGGPSAPNRPGQSAKTIRGLTRLILWAAATCPSATISSEGPTRATQSPSREVTPRAGIAWPLRTFQASRAARWIRSKGKGTAERGIAWGGERRSPASIASKRSRG